VLGGKKWAGWEGKSHDIRRQPCLSQKVVTDLEMHRGSLAKVSHGPAPLQTLPTEYSFGGEAEAPTDPAEERARL